MLCCEQLLKGNYKQIRDVAEYSDLSAALTVVSIWRSSSGNWIKRPHSSIPPRVFTPARLGPMPKTVIARWERNLKYLEGIANGNITDSAD